MEECINSTSLVGNLVRDVKYRKTNNGTSVANATLAVNSHYAERDYVTYINIKAFGSAADNLEHSVKGNPIAVTGRIASESYLTTDDETRYHTFVSVDDASPLKILKQQDTQVGGDLDTDEVFPPDEDLTF